MSITNVKNKLSKSCNCRGYALEDLKSDNHLHLVFDSTKLTTYCSFVAKLPR